MGVKAVSLPDELIKELEDAAKEGSRGFSAEVRMRCEAWPTGVAKVTADSTKEISGTLAIENGGGGPVRVNDLAIDSFRGIEKKSSGATDELGWPVVGIVGPADGLVRFKDPNFKFATKEALEPVKDEIKEVVDEIILLGGVRGGKTSKIREMAKQIPGVMVAAEMPASPLRTRPECSGTFFCECAGLAMKNGANRDTVEQLEGGCRFVIAEVHEDDVIKRQLDKATRDGGGSVAKNNRIVEILVDDSNVREVSAKKRPEITEGRVEMVKGFFKEEYTSLEMAERAALSMGWKEGEYTIKPLD